MVAQCSVLRMKREEEKEKQEEEAGQTDISTQAEQMEEQPSEKGPSGRIKCLVLS